MDGSDILAICCKHKYTDCQRVVPSVNTYIVDNQIVISLFSEAMIFQK